MTLTVYAGIRKSEAMEHCHCQKTFRMVRSICDQRQKIGMFSGSIGNIRGIFNGLLLADGAVAMADWLLDS